MDLHNVKVEECRNNGVLVTRGANVVATDCQFHHNKSDGVLACSGAVVDLMGEGTSVHDNEQHGLSAVSRGTTINVYQPCVLNDMSHGNKGQNIFEYAGGTVQQKDSKK